MYITRLKLKNWRNFRDFDAPLHECTYLIGPNASGKSNLLMFFVSLGTSVSLRGGLQKQFLIEVVSLNYVVYTLVAPEVRIEVHLSDNADDQEPKWKYILSFMPEGKGAQER